MSQSSFLKEILGHTRRVFGVRVYSRIVRASFCSFLSPYSIHTDPGPPQSQDASQEDHPREGERLSRPSGRRWYVSWSICDEDEGKKLT